MTAHMFLLFNTFGEWLGNNVAIVPIAIGLVVYIIRMEGAVRRLTERLEDMEENHTEHSKDLRQHTTDSERHVNHLHMRAMERRIDQIDSRMDKMETTMSQGFEKTLSRIDTLIRRD